MADGLSEIMSERDERPPQHHNNTRSSGPATMRSIYLAAGGAAVVVSAFTPSTSISPCHKSVQLRSTTHAVSPIRPRSCSSVIVGNAMPWSRRNADEEKSGSCNKARQSGLFGGKSKIAAVVVRNAILRIRRALAIVAAAVLVYFGSAHIHTPPSHANTAATPAVRVISGGSRGSSQSSIQLASSTASAASKARLDQMIDRYVRKHMFADDAYDPFESAYREAHADQTSSSYPGILTDTAADVLGKKEVAKSVVTDSAFDVAFAKLNKFADLLERKYGINKQLSLSSIFIASFTLPILALMVGGTVFSSRQKEMTERMAEQRYGKTMMDVSASEQVDDDVDAPDDDEDDSDDEDDDEDDEDDDED